jgi:hypothetical protein
MSNAHVAFQIDHVPGTKDIPRQAVILAQMQPLAIEGDYTRGVLTTMLQYQE